MRNRDPRYLLLLFSLVPFFLWIAGAFLVWRFWVHSWGPLAGAAVVLSGFAIVKRQERIAAWIYRTHLRKAVADAGPDQWIPVEMEKTGTQDKLHILPHSVGILQKSKDGLVLRDLRGLEIRLAKGQFVTANLSKNNLTCSILFTDHHNNDLIGFVVAPRCTGAPMEVAAYGNLRYLWIQQWAEVASTDPPPND